MMVLTKTVLVSSASVSFAERSIMGGDYSTVITIVKF